MKPLLYFGLALDYDRTHYNPLKDLVKYNYYDYELKKYIWIFSMDNLKRVTAIIGKPLTFEDQKDNINKLIDLCPALSEEISSERYKGTGYVEIMEFPKIFIIKTVIRKKEHTFKIPRENVETLWEVLCKYPLNKPVLTSTVAERVCEKLGITRFNRKDSNTFDWNKFFGSRRDYWLHLYYCAKVLEAHKVIVHHKDGQIERIKNVWESQSSIKVPQESA